MSVVERVLSWSIFATPKVPVAVPMSIQIFGNKNGVHFWLHLKSAVEKYLIRVETLAFQDPTSLYSVKGIVILDQDGNRVIARVCALAFLYVSASSSSFAHLSISTRQPSGQPKTKRHSRRVSSKRRRGTPHVRLLLRVFSVSFSFVQSLFRFLLWIQSFQRKLFFWMVWPASTGPTLISICMCWAAAVRTNWCLNLFSTASLTPFPPCFEKCREESSDRCNGHLHPHHWWDLRRRVSIWI